MIADEYLDTGKSLRLKMFSVVSMYNAHVIAY